MFTDLGMGTSQKGLEPEIRVAPSGGIAFLQELDRPKTSMRGHMHGASSDRAFAAERPPPEVTRS